MDLCGTRCSKNSADLSKRCNFIYPIYLVLFNVNYVHLKRKSMKEMKELKCVRVKHIVEIGFCYYQSFHETLKIMTFVNVHVYLFLFIFILMFCFNKEFNSITDVSSYGQSTDIRPNNSNGYNTINATCSFNTLPSKGLKR